jgi:hypothetical protein
MESTLVSLYESFFLSFFVAWNVLCRTGVRSKIRINIYWTEVGIMHPYYLPYPNFPENNPINFDVTFFLTVSSKQVILQLLEVGITNMYCFVQYLPFHSMLSCS